MIVVRFLRPYQRQHHFSRRPDGVAVGSPDSNAYGGNTLYNPSEIAGFPDAEAEWLIANGTAERIALPQEQVSRT